MSKVTVFMNLEIKDVDEQDVDKMWWAFQAFKNSFKVEHTPGAVGFTVTAYNFGNPLEVVPLPEEPTAEESSS